MEGSPHFIIMEKLEFIAQKGDLEELAIDMRLYHTSVINDKTPQGIERTGRFADEIMEKYGLGETEFYYNYRIQMERRCKRL